MDALCAPLFEALRAMRIIVFLIFVCCMKAAQACTPMLPKMIPPVGDPMGEWTEEQPPSAFERFLDRMNRASSVSVVDLYMDFHYPTEPYDAQTEFSVLYGWGKSLPRDVKYIRRTTSCGKPEKYTEGKRYVAIPIGSDYSIWPLSDLGEQIKELGEPDYRHTENGIRYSKARNK